MRITFNTINRHTKNVIIDRYNDLMKLQEQLSTGKRLLRPSDDPVDVANDLKLRSKLKQLSQFKRNIEDGLGFMQVTDTAMMSMDDIMQRLRELAIQAASDTMTVKERLYINSEVEQLARQLIGLANTSFRGDYVFAGTQTKIAPFPLESSKASSALNYANLDMAYYDASAAGPGTPIQIRDAFNDWAVTNIIPGTFQLTVGGTTYIEGTDYTIDYAQGQITINAGAWGALGVDVLDPANYQLGTFEMTFDYVGNGTNIYGEPVTNNGEIFREIEKGITPIINITSNDLMLNLDTGRNLLNTIISFGQGLIQNDSTAIETTISNIDISFKTLLSAQAKNGARINRFETTLERNELQYVETTRLHSELEDADLAEAATSFSIAETVYNAALKSAAKIIQLSLVDFL